MSVRTYKIIKGLITLSAVGTGFYAISEGADPLTTYALVALIVSGPDAWETLIGDTPTEPPGKEDDS